MADYSADKRKFDADDDTVVSQPAPLDDTVRLRRCCGSAPNAAHAPWCDEKLREKMLHGLQAQVDPGFVIPPGVSADPTGGVLPGRRSIRDREQQELRRVEQQLPRETRATLVHVAIDAAARIVSSKADQLPRGADFLAEFTTEIAAHLLEWMKKNG